MKIGNFMRYLVILVAFASHGILNAQGILKLSGGGISALDGSGRSSITMKTYQYCVQTDSCSNHKWVGFFGTKLLQELKTDSVAYHQGRRFQIAAIAKTGFYAAVPISLFSGTLEAMKGKESIVIGLTLFSLVGAITSHIIENKQFYKVEEVYNRNRLKLGIDSGERFEHIGLIFQVRI